ncbi:MAG TPA: diguanylate cyclase [Thermodesulfobacteriota bacterium]|nr:diguanylate cyclase [Thermodesulfobacteriota bacterium]
MKKNILVVDNSPLVLKFMEDLLQSRGYVVRTAEDGLSALDLLKTFVPDVMFVDLMMPNIDGAKLCHLVRTMPHLGGTHVVLFSAIDTNGGNDFSHVGADAFLSKGTFKEIAERVVGILEGSDDRTPFDDSVCFSDSDLCVPREISRELLSTRRHLETILGSMSEGILELNAQNCIVYVNPAAVSLLAIPEKELLGRQVLSLFRPADYDIVGTLLHAKAVANDTVPQGVFLDFNGRQVSVNCIPCRTDAGMTILILNDVSERTQAEAARDESERRYYSLFENAPISLWEEDCSDLRAFFEKLRTNGITDFQSFLHTHPAELVQCARMIKVVDVNKSSVRLFEADNKKDLLHALSRVSPQASGDQFPHWTYKDFKNATLALAEGKTSFEGVAVIQTVRGNSKNCIIKWSVVPGHEATLSRILVSHLDISERIQAEERLHKAKEDAEAARAEMKRMNEELAKLNIELQKQTLLDSLTGIANRRYFDQVLGEEWRRAMRTTTPLTVILGDIDHFKRFNDHYGHQEGDECLIRIARTLNTLARRPGDLVARYGGEEFAIILPNTNSKDAFVIAERARKAVQDIQIKHEASDVNEFVTISFGAASMIPTVQTNPEVILRAADKLLFQSKREGRNRVMVSD